MLQGKLMIDQRRKAKKGYPVKIYLSGHGSKKYLSTGFYATEWNDGPDRKHPNYRAIISLKLEVLRAVEYCNENHLGIHQAVKMLQEESGELEALKARIAELEGQTSLYSFWRVFMDEKKASGLDVKAYESTLDQLQSYQAKVYLQDINYEWLQGFVTFKYKQGTGKAGVSYYLRSFRTVYLEAQRRASLRVPPGNPFKGVIPSVKRKEAKSITKDQFKKIIEYTPPESTTKGNRVKIEQRLLVFAFQVYIGGHDLIDVARLTWKDLEGGRVKFSRYKNRNRSGEVVDNVLIETAQTVIQKIGTKDRKRVFGFIPDPDLPSYVTYRGNTNRLLKTVCKTLSVPVMKTKSPRYIYRSWAGEVGADLIATMQIQGHKGANVTFLYQSRLPNKIIDTTLRETVL